MNIDNLFKQASVRGSQRAGVVAVLKKLDLTHKTAYQAAVNDPDAAKQKLEAIREEIKHNKDLLNGIDAEMHEIGGKIVDARAKSYPALKEQLEKDMAHCFVEAGRHVSIGLAYLKALGAAPPADILASLKMQYPEIAEGIAIASEELERDPIASLVPRKQVVEHIRQQLTGVMSRNHMINKVIGPAIRENR